MAKEQTATKNIYQRINAVMGEVDFVKKEEKKVNGQYTFVSHDAVIGQLNRQFVKHGIAVVPTIEQMTQDGNRTTVIMRVKFVNIDNPTDLFEVCYPGYGIDSGDKGPGKAISYAYKYAMLKTFCLETGEQDPEYDAKAKYEPPKEEEAPKLVSMKAIEDFLKGLSEEDFESWKDYSARIKKVKEWDEETFKLEIRKKWDVVLADFNKWRKKVKVT